MAKEDLETVLKTKVRPIIEDAMHRYLGVTIAELEDDITGKIKRSPMLDFEINPKVSFKKSKKMFKKFYLLKLMQKHMGNISQVAIESGIERRSIHRLVKELKINPEKFRKALLRADYVKKEAVKSIIEDVLDSYKGIITKKKIASMYENVNELSKDIIKQLPESSMTLKHAEEEFEKNYILKALKQNAFNISKTARAIGLRFETLHRKMKALGV